MLLNGVLIFNPLIRCHAEPCGTSKVTLTNAQKQELLDVHNHFRSMEPAADMMELVS